MTTTPTWLWMECMRAKYTCLVAFINFSDMQYYHVIALTLRA